MSCIHRRSHSLKPGRCPYSKSSIPEPYRRCERHFEEDGGCFRRIIKYSEPPRFCERNFEKSGVYHESRRQYSEPYERSERNFETNRLCSESRRKYSEPYERPECNFETNRLCSESRRKYSEPNERSERNFETNRLCSEPRRKYSEPYRYSERNYENPCVHFKAQSCFMKPYGNSKRIIEASGVLPGPRHYYSEPPRRYTRAYETGRNCTVGSECYFKPFDMAYEPQRHYSKPHRCLERNIETFGTRSGSRGHYSGPYRFPRRAHETVYNYTDRDTPTKNVRAPMKHARIAHKYDETSKYRISPNNQSRRHIDESFSMRPLFGCPRKVSPPSDFTERNHQCQSNFFTKRCYPRHHTNCRAGERRDYQRYDDVHEESCFTRPSLVVKDTYPSQQNPQNFERNRRRFPYSKLCHEIPHARPERCQLSYLGDSFKNYPDEKRVLSEERGEMCRQYTRRKSCKTCPELQCRISHEQFVPHSSEKSKTCPKIRCAELETHSDEKCVLSDERGEICRQYTRRKSCKTFPELQCRLSHEQFVPHSGEKSRTCPKIRFAELETHSDEKCALSDKRGEIYREYTRRKSCKTYPELQCRKSHEQIIHRSEKSKTCPKIRCAELDGWGYECCKTRSELQCRKSHEQIVHRSEKRKTCPKIRCAELDGWGYECCKTRSELQCRKSHEQIAHRSEKSKTCPNVRCAELDGRGCECCKIRSELQSQLPCERTSPCRKYNIRQCEKTSPKMQCAISQEKIETCIQPDIQEHRRTCRNVQCAELDGKARKRCKTDLFNRITCNRTETSFTTNFRESKTCPDVRCSNLDRRSEKSWENNDCKKCKTCSELRHKISDERTESFRQCKNRENCKRRTELYDQKSLETTKPSFPSDFRESKTCSDVRCSKLDRITGKCLENNNSESCKTCSEQRHKISDERTEKFRPTRNRGSCIRCPELYDPKSLETTKPSFPSDFRESKTCPDVRCSKVDERNYKRLGENNRDSNKTCSEFQRNLLDERTETYRQHNICRNNETYAEAQFLKSHDKTEGYLQPDYSEKRICPNKIYSKPDKFCGKRLEYNDSCNAYGELQRKLSDERTDTYAQLNIQRDFKTPTELQYKKSFEDTNKNFHQDFRGSKTSVNVRCSKSHERIERRMKDDDCEYYETYSELQSKSSNDKTEKYKQPNMHGRIKTHTEIESKQLQDKTEETFTPDFKERKTFSNEKCSTLDKESEDRLKYNDRDRRKRCFKLKRDLSDERTETYTQPNMHQIIETHTEIEAKKSLSDKTETYFKPDFRESKTCQDEKCSTLDKIFEKRFEYNDGGTHSCKRCFKLKRDLSDERTEAHTKSNIPCNFKSPAKAQRKISFQDTEKEFRSKFNESKTSQDLRCSKLQERNEKSMKDDHRKHDETRSLLKLQSKSSNDITETYRQPNMHQRIKAHPEIQTKKSPSPDNTETYFKPYFRESKICQVEKCSKLDKINERRNRCFKLQRELSDERTDTYGQPNTPNNFKSPAKKQRKKSLQNTQFQNSKQPNMHVRMKILTEMKSKKSPQKTEKYFKPDSRENKLSSSEECSKHQLSEERTETCKQHNIDCNFEKYAEERCKNSLQKSETGFNSDYSVSEVSLDLRYSKSDRISETTQIDDLDDSYKTCGEQQHEVSDGRTEKSTHTSTQRSCKTCAEHSEKLGIKEADRKSNTPKNNGTYLKTGASTRNYSTSQKTFYDGRERNDLMNESLSNQEKHYQEMDLDNSFRKWESPQNKVGCETCKDSQFRRTCSCANSQTIPKFPYLDRNSPSQLFESPVKDNELSKVQSQQTLGHVESRIKTCPCKDENILVKISTIHSLEKQEFNNSNKNKRSNNSVREEPLSTRNNMNNQTDLEYTVTQQSLSNISIERIPHNITWCPETVYSTAHQTHSKSIISKFTETEFTKPITHDYPNEEGLLQTNLGNTNKDPTLVTLYNSKESCNVEYPNQCPVSSEPIESYLRKNKCTNTDEKRNNSPEDRHTSSFREQRLRESEPIESCLPKFTYTNTNIKQNNSGDNESTSTFQINSQKWQPIKGNVVVYKCRECGFETSNMSMLKNHERSHRRRERYKKSLFGDWLALSHKINKIN